MKDGKVVAAAEEERFTRKKHDSDFPINAIEFCFKKAGITIDDVQLVGFYDKPFLKFERILETYLDSWPRSYVAFRSAVPLWLKEKIWIPDIIKKKLKYKGEVYFIEHHMSHAASAFLVSPFREAAILTVDGVGEWATTTYGVGRDNKIEILKEIHFPHSLGLFYSAMTYYLGFKVNSAEYKVMGAAPYGEPKYIDKIRELMDIKEDGSFAMDMRYFAYNYRLKMISRKFEEHFGVPTRLPEGKIEQFHWDMAASLQKVTEEIVLKMVRHIKKETNLDNLCLAGGVALNCVANERILKEGGFKNIYIQPAAGDAGGAMGVAFYIWNSILGNERSFVLKHNYLGPEYTREEVKLFLDKNNIVYKEYERNELIKESARLIADQKVIGLFQGRMEWGPRALGNRSIIADARNRENWKRVNLKIKFRESFRPFAPTVLEDRAKEYFDLDVPSPFMLLTAPVLKDSVPAVTHVNNTARLQTVNREDNPLYYDLIKGFDDLTGCPVIINTSFNVRGEPIVCSPEDAFNCFMNTEMDYLVMPPFILEKNAMSRENGAAKNKFELD